MKRFILFILVVLLTFLFIPLQTYAYSKSQLDVSITDLNNHTLREVYENTSLFDSLQLVTNGDFSNGTTGWVDSGIITKSVTNGIIEIISQTNTSGISQQLNINGTKLYNLIRYKSSTAPFITITAPYQEYNYPIAIELSVFSSIVNTTPNTNFNILFRNRLATQILYIDYIYAFNISTLISNKQYSPIFNTTFDLMSDANIKTTMDLFVTKPYLFIDYEYYGIDSLTVEQMDYWYGVYVFNKEHEVIVTDEGLGTDLMNVLKGFINTLISLFDYIMYTKVMILGIEFSFLGLIGSGLIILILAFQIIWLVI